MKKDPELPSYPPLYFVRAAEKIRQFFLRMNRRLTHPNVALWEMVHHFWLAAGINVAAELGIADLVKEKPREIDELADMTNTDQASLYRIMRMLSSKGIFRELRGKRFTSTRLSEPLREDQIRYLLLLHLTPRHFEMFGDLMKSVKSGEPVTKGAGGSQLFDHIGNDNQRNERFNNAMSNASKMQASTVLSVYSFNRYGKIIDVGGGQGLFLSAILRHSQESTGIVFDLTKALERTKQIIEEASLEGRMEPLAGDFFKEVPAGGDLYILKSVLHDWDDGNALKILQKVNAAMEPGSKLLILESVIDEGNKPSFGKMTDILMMVAAGGKERTKAQFEELLGNAGFRIRKIYPTISPHSIIEAEKV